jgi:mono/diheme cytochrome c family protein
MRTSGSRNSGISSSDQEVVFGCLVAVLILLAGCRGQISEDPPMRVIRDMVHQPKTVALSSTVLQGIPAGRIVAAADTVAREASETQSTGAVVAAKRDILDMPLQVSELTIARGRRIFVAHCSPCHDPLGTGHGIVVQRGYPTPVDLASSNTRQLSDAQLYRIIGSGIRNMPSLAEQVSSPDRWAAVTWIRVLQLSRTTETSSVAISTVSARSTEANTIAP